MELGLKGKWALVGGASKGLGLGCAQSLAREGANVVIVARGAEALDAAASELRKLGTTILAVRKNGKTVVAGDGQVSMGQTVVKGNARKVRTLAGGKVIAGFAGATAGSVDVVDGD